MTWFTLYITRLMQVCLKINRAHIASTLGLSHIRCCWHLLHFCLSKG
jgi:hypothetical protein